MSRPWCPLRSPRMHGAECWSLKNGHGYTGLHLVWFKPVLLTGYHTGMRLEETLTLMWDRVDLEKGRIFLSGHLTKTGQERLVPITPTLRREFQRLRELDGVTRIEGLVFHKNGEKLCHTYLRSEAAV